MLVAIVAGALLVHRFALFTVVVTSGSMRPAFEPGDILIATRVPRRPVVRRGRIVVFASRERGGLLVKRVAGLPGERIELDGASVRADGVPSADPHGRGGAYRGAFSVPADAYLLLGDDRDASDDARSWDDPYVEHRDLRGVVRARLVRSRGH